MLSNAKTFVTHEGCSIASIIVSGSAIFAFLVVTLAKANTDFSVNVLSKQKELIDVDSENYGS